MNKPQLYLKNSKQPLLDFEFVCKKYLSKLKFNEHCNAMDIGCGPGNLTRDGFLRLLPKSASSLVGADISPQMINYAKEHYETDPKISFQVFDILTDNIPKEYCERFDHILSAYCLHFVGDQRKAIRNMYGMLKPGGDIFVYFLSKNITFDFCKSLEDRDKYKPFLVNYKERVTPTHAHDYPEEYFKKILEEANFVIDYIVSEERAVAYSKQEFFDIVTATKLPDIPERVNEEYGSEFLSFMETNNLIKKKEDGEEYVHNPFTLLIVHATKGIK